MTIVESGPEQQATTKEQQPFVAPTTWREQHPDLAACRRGPRRLDHRLGVHQGQRHAGIGESRRPRSCMDWLQRRDPTPSQLSQSGFFAAHCTRSATFLNWLVQQLQHLFSQPDVPRPYPQVGWLGVLAIAGWVTLALAGWRNMILTVAVFLSFGCLGYCADSIDTLIITGVAVIIAVVIGIPFAIWMGQQQEGDRGRHADPRRPADVPVVHLPAPVLRSCSASARRVR